MGVTLGICCHAVNFIMLRLRCSEVRNLVICRIYSKPEEETMPTFQRRRNSLFPEEEEEIVRIDYRRRLDCTVFIQLSY
jgi:hypothetical protein